MKLKSHINTLGFGLALTLVGAGCDKISTAKVDEVGAVTSIFAGADRVALQSKGSYLLTWPELSLTGSSKKDVTYDIYGTLLSDQTGYPAELFSTKGEMVDATSTYLTASLADNLSPAGKSLKVGSAVNKNSYEVSSNTILTSNGVYLLQVRVNAAASGTKTVDANSRVVIFRYGVAASQALSSYSGCLGATATGTSTARIDFKLPSGADKVEIFRNGAQISTIDDATATSFSDGGLSQGVTYSYACQVTAGSDKKKGASVSVTIPVSIPPTFAGITALTASSSSTLTATWALATGTLVSQYNVYCTAGPTIDWTAQPVATFAASGTGLGTISGLGDEIPYSCGVRACAFGNVCDTNTVGLLRTTPDGGAPKSRGISSITLVNGQAVVNAPWQMSDGAVWKRRIYICTGNVSTCGTNLSNYSLAATNMSTQVYAPNTSITLTTTISQNTTYSFLLTDEDTSGNISSLQAVPSLLTTGDLTKPTFSGLSSLSVGTPSSQSDTTMTLNFTAITRESDNAVTGASHYQVYYFQGSGDACATGTLRSEFLSTSYTPGTVYTYLVTGLTPRTTYSFCLKARDSAGNVSDTTQFYTKQTQDVTAPAFDGVQGITYDAATGTFTTNWNRSTSTDRSSYKLSISKNNGAYTTFTYTDAAQPSGISFTKTSLGFSFADLDLLKIYVNACDDASVIVGGTDNCTTLSTPLVYTVPDVSPPSNFTGIDAGNTVNAGQGNVTVAWIAPSPAGTWSSEGYRGFIVYSVDQSNNLTQLKDCACAQTDCSDHLTSCLVTGLDARRTYKFHVRAYDGSRNITTSLNPATSVATLQTVDTTAPTFNANAATSIVSSAIQLTWNAATDNQYASESGAAITYQVYRKTGSNFASLTSPQSDADVGFPVTKNASPFVESAVAAGTTYYYTVCAKDSSNNRTCAVASTSITPPDLTAPTVTAFASNKTAAAKTWNLTWTMSDNVTATGSLHTQIYVSYSASAGTATTSDTLLYSALGVTTKTGLVGRQNANEYVNYLLVVTDDAGNSSTAALSLYSTNLVTITSITRNTGSTAGGKFIWVQGTGFDSTATLTIGGQPCANTVTYYLSTMMGCTTPAATAGTYSLVVTNSEGSTASASYTYYTYSGAGSDHVCDNPTQPTATFYSGGGGSTADPYLICTGTQFMLIGPAASNKFFKLMDNLDVASFNANNFGSISFSSKFLNGNNMVIANWTRAYAAGLPTDANARPSLGLLAPSGGSVTNLGLLNVNLNQSAAPSGGSVGALAGWFGGTFSTTNVFAQGTIVGVSGTNPGYTGGLIGSILTQGGGTHTGDWFAGSVSASSTSVSAVGGLIGAWDDSLVGASSVSNCYSTGTVSSGGNYIGGLIGQLMPAASTTTDVTLNNCYSNASVSSGGNAGGLIGGVLLGPANKNFTLSSVYATGSVSGASNLGGLIGTVASISSGTSLTINNAYATGAVTGTSIYVGGLIGNYSALGCTTAACNTISNSYATGAVNVGAGSGYSGGFVGRFYGATTSGANTLITNSYATGSVTGTFATANYFGGFIGIAQDGITITNSYATGAVSGVGSVGGFVGSFGYSTASGEAMTIQKSYSTGTVSVSGGSPNGGGFVGIIDTCSSAATTAPAVSISQSYSTSAVSGSTVLGGFAGAAGVGTCSGGGANATISDSYSTGAVSGLNTLAGFISKASAGLTLTRVFATGVVTGASATGGLFSSGTATAVNDSFWDTTATTQSTSSGGTGKTTTQMQTQSTFTNFDFTTTPVWKISAGQYPKLGWQP